MCTEVPTDLSEIINKINNCHIHMPSNLSRCIFAVELSFQSTVFVVLSKQFQDLFGWTQ